MKLEVKFKEIGKSGYFVSDNGNVYDSSMTKVKTYINACGYRYVVINGRIRTIYYLVANAFVDNPNGMICVWHNDGNKLNDKANNLTWYYELDDEDDISIEEDNEEENNVDKEYEEVEKQKSFAAIEIDAYDLEGNLIGSYPSIAQAGRELGIPSASIRSAMFCDRKIIRKELVVVKKGTYVDKEIIKDYIKEQEGRREQKGNYKTMFILDENDNIIKRYISSFEAYNDSGATVNYSSFMSRARNNMPINGKRYMKEDDYIIMMMKKSLLGKKNVGKRI